jgi:3-oxoadipate enol-lactonase
MFIQSNGQSHHVLVAGDPKRPAVVLLHSLGGNALIWGPQIADLSADHYVICPDLRGHGLTPLSEVPVTIELLAQDVDGILDTLGINKVRIAGLSIGGMVAQVLAATNKRRVDALAIFDSSIASLDPKMWRDRAQKILKDGLTSIAGGVLSRWVTPQWAGLPETAALARMLAQTLDEGYAAGCDALAVADCRVGSGGLAIPVIVAVGEADQATPLAASEMLAATISGAQLRIIKGAAHIPTLHRAGEVTDILRDMLAL